MSIKKASKGQKEKHETAVLVPLLELHLTVNCSNLEVNDHLDLTEPSRHAFASSAMVLLELCGCMWNECVYGWVSDC